MGNANRPLAEASFAVREIEMPQALEGLVVSQLFQFLTARHEPITPVPQRSGVVKAEVFGMGEYQV